MLCRKFATMIIFFTPSTISDTNFLLVMVTILLFPISSICKRRKSILKTRTVCHRRKKELHRTAVILSSVLEIVRRRKLAFELVREIDESDVCMKFERKALKTKTVIACQRISLDGDHFGRRSWKPWIAERPT